MRVMALTVISLAAAMMAQAASVVIVDNLSQPPVGTDVGLNAAAQQFIVGGTSLTLQDVTLDLIGIPGEVASVDVSLFSDDSGLPGTSLLSLGELTPSGTGFADYTASGTYSLAADTPYWIVVDYLGVPSWGYTNDNTYSGTGTLGTFANSDNGGTSWNGPYDDQPYILEVTGTTGTSPVPEPSSVILLSAMLLAFAFAARKCNARAKVRPLERN